MSSDEIVCHVPSLHGIKLLDPFPSSHWQCLNFVLLPWHKNGNQVLQFGEMLRSSKLPPGFALANVKVLDGVDNTVPF